MSLKSKKPSLAEKISSLITAAPTNFCSDDEDDATKAKVVDDDSDFEREDVGTSSLLRKNNISLLENIDERYKGKKVSRKDIYGEESSDEQDASEIDDNLEDDDDDNDDDDASSLDGGSDGEESLSDNQEESDIDESNPLRRNRNAEMDFPSMNPKNLSSEVEKGNCVREQLKRWENLLEMRIQVQKCLITSNKMPQFDVYKEFQSDKQFTKATEETKSKLTNVLDNLLQIEAKLWKSYPETNKLLDKNSTEKDKQDDDPMDEEICSDTEDEENEQQSKDEKSEDEESKEPAKKKRKTCAEYEKILDERHKIYRPYRNGVIQKWNDKTRVATGSANKGTNQAVVKQIEFVLNDKQKIIKKTQLKRSEYNIVGKVGKDETDEDGRRTQEYDAEIYDDDDFYHQLLRELIEHKSADITDPIQLSKQWIQLQNMRNKMKRKIDTRATKGRRVRYNVHTKLVNFMAPNTVSDTWSDAAKNEFYNSLFGTIKVVEK